MTKKKDTNGVDGISSSGATKGVKATDSVSSVDKVKATQSIRGVSGVTGVRSTSGVSSISFEQREKLLGMVTEEAEKLAAQGLIPKSQRQVVEQAVKMIIDSTLIEPSTEKDKK
jgi:hypothetical protein